MSVSSPIKNAAVFDPNSGKVYEGIGHMHALRVAYEAATGTAYDSDHRAFSRWVRDVFDPPRRRNERALPLRQGFTNQRGEFLDRIEALNVAIAHGQVVRPHEQVLPRILCSESLRPE